MATHAAFAKLSAGAVSSAFGRTTSSRVATMFGSADPKVERMLRGAMVAAAARFGSKHQAEIRSVLSDDAAFTGRRDALKKALLGAAALLPVSEASAADDQGVASSRMSYSRFLEYLDRKS